MNLSNNFQPESENREYKEYIGPKTNLINSNKPFNTHREKFPPDRFKKEIGAFLNNNIQNGFSKSRIYIGINDNTRKFNDKYTLKERNNFKKAVGKWLNTDFFPSAAPYVHITTKKNHPIIVYVKSPSHLCFFTKLKKKGWIMFTRTYTLTDKATPTDMFRLIRKSSLLYNYDETRCFRNHKLTFNYLYKKYNKLGPHVISCFYTMHHHYTNTALFFSDQNPSKIIIIIHNSKYKLLYRGSIISQIDKSIHYMYNYINNHKEHYPKVAIKEAIINAFAHRSYLYYRQDSIIIYIYNNKIDISSPGGLPGGLSLKEMKKGYSFIRNFSIFFLLRLFKYSQRNDSGFLKIESSYDDIKEGLSNKIKITLKHNKLSELKSTRFILVLPRINDLIIHLQNIPNKKERVILYLKHKKYIMPKTVRILCEVKSEQARRITYSLSHKRIIKKYGNGPATIYKKYINYNKSLN